MEQRTKRVREQMEREKLIDKVAAGVVNHFKSEMETLWG